MTFFIGIAVGIVFGVGGGYLYRVWSGKERKAEAALKAIDMWAAELTRRLGK